MCKWMMFVESKCSQGFVLMNQSEDFSFFTLGEVIDSYRETKLIVSSRKVMFQVDIDSLEREKEC